MLLQLKSQQLITYEVNIVHHNKTKQRNEKYPDYIQCTIRSLNYALPKLIKEDINIKCTNEKKRKKYENNLYKVM